MAILNALEADVELLLATATHATYFDLCIIFQCQLNLFRIMSCGNKLVLPVPDFSTIEIT